MFTVLRSGLGNALRTKVGLAVIGATLIGGAGTAMAVTTAHHAQPPTAAHAAHMAPSAASATAPGHASAHAGVSPTGAGASGRGHGHHHHSHL